MAVSRISPIDPKNATPEVTKMLETVEKALGSVPNIARTLGQSPVALRAWLSLMDATEKGTFDAPTR